jgi:small subunit ribosomal protein S15
MALTKRKKTNEMKKVRRHEDDTGSPEAQIAVLTREIDDLATHLRKNRTDRDSRLGLLKKVEKRRKLVRYLQGEDPERYNEIAEELDLKKIDLEDAPDESDQNEDS